MTATVDPTISFPRRCLPLEDLATLRMHRGSASAGTPRSRRLLGSSRLDDGCSRSSVGFALGARPSSGPSDRLRLQFCFCLIFAELSAVPSRRRGHFTIGHAARQAMAVGCFAGWFMRIGYIVSIRSVAIVHADSAFPPIGSGFQFITAPWTRCRSLAPRTASSSSRSPSRSAPSSAPLA